MKKMLYSLSPFSEEELRQLSLQCFSATPSIRICKSFVAVLHQNGVVTVRENQEEKEIGRYVTQISSGKDHLLCLHDDNTVTAYGCNQEHQCDVDDWKNVRLIQAGDYCSAALTYDDQTLWAGQLETKNDTEASSTSSLVTNPDDEIVSHIFSLNARYAENDGNGTILKEYKCSVCGNVSKDTTAPDQCSVCQAPGHKIIVSNTSVSNIELTEGSVPVIFSAPYSVCYKRNGEIRQANAYTGAIVDYLCQKYHTHGITRIFNINDDPNASADIGNYRKTLENYIQTHRIFCLIDLYEYKSNIGYSVYISTNNGKNINPNFDITDLLKSILYTACQISIDDDKGIGRNTICNYVHKKRNISCYRIELSNLFKNNINRLTDIIEALGAFTERLAQMANEKIRFWDTFLT